MVQGFSSGEDDTKRGNLMRKANENKTPLLGKRFLQLAQKFCNGNNADVLEGFGWEVFEILSHKELGFTNNSGFEKFVVMRVFADLQRIRNFHSDGPRNANGLDVARPGRCLVVLQFRGFCLSQPLMLYVTVHR